LLLADSAGETGWALSSWFSFWEELLANLSSIWKVGLLRIAN